MHRTKRSLLAAVVPLAIALSLAPAAVRAAGETPGKASPVKREQAQARFERGKQYFAAKKYPEALDEFRASFEIVASPNTHLYIARTLREMGKLVDAYVEFGRTAVEAKELAVEDSRYAKTADAATAERNELAPKLAFVTVTVENASDATTLKVAGEEVRRAGWGEPVPTQPGPVEVVVESPSRAPERRSLTLKAGDKETLTIDAAAAPAGASPSTSVATSTRSGSDHSGLRPYAYVAGAVGVVGLATFVIEGLSARSTFNTLHDQCAGPCPASRQSDIDAGNRAQTIANVGLVVGIVGVATGTTLFFLSGSASKPEAPHTALSVTPWSIAFQGAF